MKKFLKHIASTGLLAGSMLLMGNSFGQCPNNNVFWATAPTPGPGATVSVAGTWGGEYVNLSVTNGQTYVISTCGGGSWDSQITLYNGASTTPLGYNDDFCGTQSQITWTATFTGTLRIVLDQYFCTNNSSPMTIFITRQAASAYNPCTGITSLTCASGTVSANITSGNGAWSSYGGPYTTPGRERIFQFTPTVTGLHNFTVTNSSTGWIDLFWKAASGGCNNSGWTFVNDISGTETWGINLTAGVTYYIMLDDEDINGSTASISVACPSPAVYNPCTTIGNLSCGATTAVSNPAGNGAWSSYGGPWTTPGTERLFTFTAPFTGSYTVSVNHSSSGYVDLFFKQSSTGCNNSAWTYVNDIFTGTESSIISLTGGVTYFMMLDDEDVNASSSTINITCPPPPCVGSSVDGSYTYSGAFNINGNTIGACNNSYTSTYPSEDLTYAISVGCAGSYTFTTCGGASWDTYLFLSSTPGGTPIASNDDACSLQSSITASLTAGTYYITVEGFSSTSGGAFTLNVSGSGWTPSISGSATDATCFGASNGSIIASVDGNGNGATATLNGNPFTGSASGLAAGTYTLIASNCWGSTTQIFTVGQPSALSASSTSGSIACNGGTTTVTVSGSGGTAPYSGTGSFTVGAGSYTYTVTDANGCTAVTSITVSEPSALSASSTSGSILCNGGTTTVTVSGSGGTAPYSGTGSFTVGAGSYTYTVTDANGCTAVTSITVSEPSALSASSTSGSILCNGGTTTVTVSGSGGTAPYSGTGSFTVGAGSYTYTVTDANGCTAVTSITVSEPSALSASSSSGSILCNGGTTTVTVSGSGGAAPYSGTGTFTVAAGSYSYTITDANGCSAVTTINVTEPSVLTLLASPSSFDCGYGVSCNGSTDGFVLLSANGGTPSYSYSGSATGALGAGTYNYVVTDANGCVATASATLTEPAPMSINLVTSDYNGYGVSCFGSTNGWVASVVAGGCSSSYSYSWSNGSNAVGLTGVGAGNYNLTVTDGNGCSANASAGLIEPAELTVDAGNNVAVYPAYPGASCATLTANVSGGTPYFLYMWETGSDSSTTVVCPTATTTYYVNVEDANGCTASDQVTVCAADITCSSNGASGNNANPNALSNRANLRVYICHHTGHGEMTMCLPISAVADHLAHGDILGECGATYNCDPDDPEARVLGSDNMDELLIMSVYPNPSTSDQGFNLNIVSGKDTEGYVDVMDISGKIVTPIRYVSLNAGELYNDHINVHLTPGIYFVRLNTFNGEVQTIKIVIR